MYKLHFCKGSKDENLLIQAQMLQMNLNLNLIIPIKVDVQKKFTFF